MDGILRFWKTVTIAKCRNKFTIYTKLYPKSSNSREMLLVTNLIPLITCNLHVYPIFYILYCIILTIVLPTATKEPHLPSN